MDRLYQALESYSPLRLIKKAPALPGLGILVETGEGRTPPPTSVEQLLPQLLDQMIALGKTAKELKQALGSNGHQADKLKEIREYLEHQSNK